MGHTFVNQSILKSLRAPANSKTEDFWWLNNGVTVLADSASLIGRQLHLENVQIVNGLQTTESIHQYFTESAITDEDRCILAKVLVAPQKVLADKIILATNNQNKVDLASLRATDKIQRDIEDILLTGNWYYDRRKHYYLNHGKPRSRIVSMKYLVWVILALVFGEPHACNRSRPKYLLKDYDRIFSERYSLNMYLVALEFVKAIEKEMLDRHLTDHPYSSRQYATMYRFLYAHLVATKIFGRATRTAQEISGLRLGLMHNTMLGDIHTLVVDVKRDFGKAGKSLRRLHRNIDFTDMASDRCLESSE
jgi:hypothetical protein